MCYSLSVFYLGFTEFMYRQADSYQSAYLWLKISAFWPFAVASLMHFILVFTEKESWLKNKLTYVLIYVPALIFSIFALNINLMSGNPIREYWGYTYAIPEYSWVYTSSSIWAVGLAFFGIFLCIRRFLKVTGTKKKQQIKYVTAGLFITVFSGTVTEVLLPIFNIKIPELTVASLTIECIFIGYAIWKYKLFTLDLLTVAENIISIMPDSLILINPEGNVVIANPAILKLLGYKEDELIGKSIKTIFAEEAVTLFEGTGMKKLIEEGFLRDCDMTYETKSGKKIPVSFSGSAMKDEDGNLIGIVGIAKDITERRKSEKVLEKLIQELEERQKLLEKQKYDIEVSRRAIKNVATDMMEAKEILEYQKGILEDVNKELDDFTYIVSHDLKEPLRSIDAYSKFVIDDYNNKLDEEGRHYLERIRANTERMKKLIEDLLEISRLKKRGSTIEEVDIAELIGEAKMRVEYLIKQKGAEIIIKGALPKVFCDRVRLTEAFLNLITNAIKFNDKSKPVVEIGCNDKADFYEFYVKDNGIGIKEEYFDKIFEIFQRLGKREDFEGTGAGLTIVKKIIQMHKGEIWIKSKTGEGSEFYFTIPKEKSVILGKKLIGEILVEKKLITEEEIKKALEEQQRIKRPGKGGQNDRGSQNNQDTAG